MADFPPMETMLEDLAKVEGLGWVFQMLAMVASIDPGILTEGEREVIEATQPIPYRLTDAGKAHLEGGSCGDCGGSGIETDGSGRRLPRQICDPCNGSGKT